MAIFSLAATAFGICFRRSGRELPERLEPGDLLLIAVATHKASRLVTKDRVTSAVRAPFTRFQADGGPGEVEEQARGHGLRRAVGELVTCPYCVGVWLSTGFAAGYATAPRPTRWLASMLACASGADVLQVVHIKLERTL
jgi:hypothetical protein